MKSQQIRRSFVDFFVERQHREVPSAPLVPQGDPTLLFTNAGMVQFKDVFLGLERAPSPRAVSVQKCLRVSGKHSDLENVGPSPRHHTFFEMLGNFSFGDYFKEEAIALAWELVTDVWGLAPDHLSATVFREDEEAFELWRKVAGLPAERIHRHGEEDNFWAMGDVGPCGPCSEIFVDRSPELPEVGWEEGTASGRYLELWNLVFMQYQRDGSGKLEPLPHPSIDTGAGLERVAAVLQGVESNYHTDLFRPLLEAAAELAGREYGSKEDDDVSMRVIADHLRAVAFLLADGVIPGNEGRGYVLRRLLRRAVRHGTSLGFEEPFLYRLAPVLEEVMGEGYPELAASRAGSEQAIRAEEEKFLATVATGARQVQAAVEELRREGQSRLPGTTVFRLYDTHGLPLELIREIAEEERFGLDERGFEEALEEQRRRSRAATGEAQESLSSLRRVLRGDELGTTPFEGYAELRLDGATVTRLARLDGETALEAASLGEGDPGVAILDRTVFYAEAGGQVGDRGWIRWSGGEARVRDTQRDPSGTVFHFLEVTEGRLAPGERVGLEVDPDHRRPTEQNHTATHLLHAALRRVLGEGVRQAGSLVAPDRLRFDYTHGEPPPRERLREIEDLANEWIRHAVPIEVDRRSYREAIAAGAMALFGEKYGEEVRTVEVPGFSLELCGGCHVANTGQIGLLKIVADRAVASGVRRIEALTGRAAFEWLRRRDEWLAAVEARLGVPAERLEEGLDGLEGRRRELEEELSRLRVQLVAGGAGERTEGVEVAGVRVVAREVPPAPANELRNLADVLRGKVGSGVVVLGTRDGDKVSLVASVSDDLTARVRADVLVKELAGRLGGGGGGRADFAQAGGKGADRLPAALEEVPRLVESQMAQAPARR